MQVSVADAKNKLPELLKLVEGGETVTICRCGVPVVDLVRTETGGSRMRRFGTLRGRIQVHDPNWWKPISEKQVHRCSEPGARKGHRDRDRHH